MAKPQIKYLEDEEVERIHQSSLDILAKVGMLFPSKKALDVFNEAGAEVNYNTGLVKVPPHLVEESIRKAPSEFTLFARNPKFNMRLEKSKTYFGAFGYAVYVLDDESGERRLATRADLETFIRLIDALEYVFCTMPAVTPQDVEKEWCNLYSWAICLQNTEKHITGPALGAQEVVDAINMSSMIVGSEKRLRTNPIISFGILTSPPLQIPKLAVDGLIEAARRKIPFYVSSGPIAGATSPITLAGTLALANAEVLGCITLAQLVSPSCPVLYASWSRIMDMKTANVSLSSPEWVIFRACIAQLANYYRLPIRTGAMLCDAKSCDVQSGIEKGMTALMAALSGNIVHGMQLDSDKMVSLADIVIDNEVAGMVYRVLKGFDVNEDTLAMDVIKNVGFGGNFLTNEHTLKHFKTEIWYPKILDRSTYEKWKRSGGKTVFQKAREKAMELLKLHQTEPLPEDIQRDINEYISRRVRKDEMNKKTKC